MSDTLTNEPSASKLMRRARFAEERRRLTQFRERLAACPHWLRGADLVAGIDETLRDIDALEERLASKSVIAVVGGSGVGKSSLVNALCGCRNAVVTGISRPTTRKAAAVVRSVQDADILLDHFDRGDMDVVPIPGTALPDTILVDAPDTDSVECETYSGILDRVLENADVLVCVFDARNPKRKDNLDRLVHFVAKFQGQHIVLVLNQPNCIIPAESLERDVIPDFREELGKSWPGAKTAKLFCTAAPAATSEDIRNEIDDLMLFLQKIAGKSFLDERVARAAFLREGVEEEIRKVLREQGDWGKLAEDVRRFESEISRQLAERFPATDDGAGSEDDMAALLRVVTPLWWGPIGLFLGFSRRFRRLVQTPFRLSDLLLPLGILRRIHAFVGDEADSGRTPKKDAGEAVFSWDDLPEELRLGYASLSDRMVEDFGMDPALRDEKSAFAFTDLSTVFRRSWLAAHDEEVRKGAKRCSGFLSQLLLNACTIAPAGYILCVIGETFLRRDYLPVSFYRQGLALLALLWLLSSWLLQIRLNRTARSIPDLTMKRFAERNPSARILSFASEIELLVKLTRTK